METLKTHAASKVQRKKSHPAQKKVFLTRSVDRACDFYDTDLKALNSPHLAKQLEEDITAAGFTLAMPPQFKRFEGGGAGISFLAMLTESHVAIHTAPEKRGCLEITVHTCEVEGITVKKTPAEKTEALIAKWEARFKPAKTVWYEDRVRADADW